MDNDSVPDRRQSLSSDARCIITAMSEVTRILDQIQQGDPHAADQLLPLVNYELRKTGGAETGSGEERGQGPALGKAPSFLRRGGRGHVSHPDREGVATTG
jgi:hypothetical protein